MQETRALLRNKFGIDEILFIKLAAVELRPRASSLRRSCRTGDQAGAHVGVGPGIPPGAEEQP